MSLVRISTVSCLLLAGLLTGCGDGSNGERLAPPADSPDAGAEAVKKIMQVQPPPPPGASKKSHR